MPLIDLPTCRERSAPSFDESQPEELERYFSDLEGLFDLYTVVNEEERKQAALRYLPVRTEHLWKTAATYTDRTRSFAEFRAEIFRLYPGTSNDRTYTIQDFDVLIGHYARTGIISAGDLGDYYRRFLLISRYLIDKGHPEMVLMLIAGILFVSLLCGGSTPAAHATTPDRSCRSARRGWSASPRSTPTRTGGGPRRPG